MATILSSVNCHPCHAINFTVGVLPLRFSNRTHPPMGVNGSAIAPGWVLSPEKAGKKLDVQQKGKAGIAQRLSKDQPSSFKAHSAGVDQGDKFLCMAGLLSSLRLASFPQGPVFVLIGQIVRRDRWMDILLPILDRFLAEDVRLIILGSVRDKDGSTLRFVARKHVSKFSYLQEYDSLRVRHVIRGSHMLLAPAPLEELGGTLLTQALRCGTIPVAYAKRDLRRLVQEYDEISNTGYGFFFYDSTPNAFLDSIRQSIDIFHKNELWQSMVARAVLAGSS